MYLRPLLIFAALACTPMPFSRAALNDKLEVYIDFDDNTLNNAGTGTYATKVEGKKAVARFTAGKFGSAGDFRALPKHGAPTDDWALILPASLNEVYRKDWSVSLWINTSETEEAAVMGNKNWASGSNPGWAITTYNGGTLATTPKQGMVNWAIKGGSRRDVRFEPENSIVAGKWRHLVATFDRTNNRVCVYLDGELVNKAANNDFAKENLVKTTLDAGLTTAIGATAGGTWGATALVDDVAIWSRVIEPWEIKALDARPAKIPEPATYGLLGAGALGLAALARRRRRAR